MISRIYNLNDPFIKAIQFKEGNYQLVMNYQFNCLNYLRRYHRQLKFIFYFSIICKYLETVLLINLMQHIFLPIFYFKLIHENTVSL